MKLIYYDKLAKNKEKSERLVLFLEIDVFFQRKKFASISNFFFQAI